MKTVQLGIPVTASNVLVRKYVGFIFKFLQSSNHPAVEFDLCFLCSMQLTNVLLFYFGLNAMNCSLFHNI